MLSWFSSLSIANQAALWGLIVVAVPILIHLINPSKGRLIWVGNIQLIKKVRQARVNQLKIKHWLLLLIRLLIIILCCLLVAGLWSGSNKQTDKKPMLLITPAWLAGASEQDKRELINQNFGAQLILLDEENSAIETTTLFSNELIASLGNPEELSYAELIEKQGTLKFSPSNSVLAITNRYSSLESPSELNLIFGEIYSRDTTLESVQEKITVLIVSDDERASDSKIVSRGFNILPEDIKERFNIKAISYSQLKGESSPLEYDVVFILSNKKLDVIHYVKQNGLLVSDSATEVNLMNNKRQLFLLNEQTFQVYSEQSSSQKIPVWRSAAGQDILSYQKHDGIHQLFFASRFHPRWTNLVENEQFPFILADLIQRYLSRKHWTVSSSHFKADELVEERAANSYLGAAHQDSLYAWILILLVCLWLIERILAEKNAFLVKRGKLSE